MIFTSFPQMSDHVENTQLFAKLSEPCYDVDFMSEGLQDSVAVPNQAEPN